MASSWVPHLRTFLLLSLRMLTTSVAAIISSFYRKIIVVLC